MANPWFNVRKAAQIAAFFAREEGGAINVLKLTKLVYLADRRNMEKYDVPISGDNFVSMDHGPVNSITYNYINGMEDQRDSWAEFIADRAGYEVGLVKSISDDDLDQLSRAEIDSLREVWAHFGKMDRYQIRDWTHHNCPEWEDPQGSSAPIAFERVFGFLNKSNARELADQIRSQRFADTVFATVPGEPREAVLA
ncbi:MAG: Panacea domain-containing protein [Pseudomonadota bacterium]|nr:Panacea domain-containing protein [Pseudomonadota bacterium]